jgi:hypothetical protein
MKKIILIASIVCLSGYTLVAQTSTETVVSNKYLTAMQTNLQVLDTAGAPASFIMLANNFERIGTAEKTKWEPFYYAAYCYATMALNTPDKTKVDMLADKAELYLVQADKLQKNNSEISTLFAMIKSAKISVDPMNRWMSMGQEVTAHISNAKDQDSNNPRPYLIDARIKYRMPEALGGGKEAAKALLTEAVKKFKSFTPSGSIAPNWGLKSTESFLENLNKL